MKNNHLKLAKEWIIKAQNNRVYLREECQKVLDIAKKLTQFIIDKII